MLALLSGSYTVIFVWDTCGIPHYCHWLMSVSANEFVSHTCTPWVPIFDVYQSVCEKIEMLCDSTVYFAFLFYFVSFFVCLFLFWLFFFVCLFVFFIFPFESV